MDCLFCAIVAGDVASRQIYADDHAIAFLDIAPWHRGHTLVVPRRHVPDVLDQSGVLGEIAPAVEHVSQLLVDRLGADGLNLLTNNRPVSGQEVFHLHMHLIPRYARRPGMRGLLERDPDAGADLDALCEHLAGAQ